MTEGRIADLDTPIALKTKYNVSNMDEVFFKIARNKE